MKNQNPIFIAIVFALAIALAPVTQAAPNPGPGPGPGPVPTPANEGTSSAYLNSSENVQLPVVTIYSTGDVIQGKTGWFVLNMNPPLGLGGTYVNVSVSGTAIPGVDYVPLASPAYINQSGYGVIPVKTLPDPRGFNQAYSLVVKLEPGPGYAIGEASSAKMAIMP